MDHEALKCTHAFDRTRRDHLELVDGAGQQLDHHAVTSHVLARVRVRVEVGVRVRSRGGAAAA